MSDKKTIIKNFQSMKPSIVFKQLDYSKLPKEVRDKMKGDLSGVSDDTLDLQFEQSTFKRWIETFADLYPAAFGIKEDAKVVSIAPVAKVEPVVKAETIVVAEEKPVDTSELETKIKDLETRLSVVNKMILKQPLKKTELKIRVKTIEKMIAKFKEELKNTKTASKKKVLKKSLGGFLFGALGGFIAGQLVDLKLTRKKVRFDLGGTLEGDKKYQYSVTYQTITPESAENGDFDDSGFEVEKTIDELQDILQEAVNRYYIHEPSSTKNGKPVSGTWWSSVSPNTDRDYFEKGIEKYYSLHISNIDGTELSDEEAQLINNKLKEGRKLHWDEEEKNWWKDGGEIHSKDNDGNLVFKADTKGGKYSIEVRQDSNIHGIYYSINNYTNGSLRGAGTKRNKEMLMHNLIDTILGSKKIDGINYIISHDDLGVKEYLPASEKIWDIYNSAEYREWFKKQNETLTQEQKQSLSDELNNKTIKYIRDNEYKEDSSTIGDFFHLFRKERLIKDFYESKGMVMLENGGEIEKYETLTFKTREKAEQNEKEIKDYFDSRFIKSEVLLGKDERGNEGFYVKYQLKKELGDKFENGGDVQTQKWLSDMNQERLNELKEQRAKIEKEMPEDYKETSGGSGRTKAEILADFDRHISERENKKFENGGGVYSIPYDTETTGVFKLVADGVNTTIRLAGAEKNDSDTYSFYQFDTDRNDEIGSIIVNNRAIDKLSKGVTVIGTGSKNGIKYKITRVSNVFENGGGVGNVESEINDLYSKSNFINDSFNWKMKLLEMLQDRSIEAYNVYQSLNANQKEEVLQALFEADNDMGSDGDGELSTSKENLEILLEDAENGNKYSNGGGVSKWKFNVGDKVMLTPLTFFSKKGFERYDLTKPVTIVGRKKVALNTDGEYRLDNTTINNEYFIKVFDGEGGLPIVTAKENELTLVAKYSNGGGIGKAIVKYDKNLKMWCVIDSNGKPIEEFVNKHNAVELANRLNKKNEYANGGGVGEVMTRGEIENKIDGLKLRIAKEKKRISAYETTQRGKYNKLWEEKIVPLKKELDNLSELWGKSKYANGGGVEDNKMSLIVLPKDKSYFDEVLKRASIKTYKIEKGSFDYVYHFYDTKDRERAFGYLHTLFANGGGIGKAIENLHSKASSSTTPRGKNKLKIPDAKYVAIHESKDGYWTIASKPTTKENAEGMLGGTPRGELGKVVTLEEALNHKKVIGEEYLKMKDGGSVSSDNTPKVYIADLAAYNEGSLVGEWLDLSEFGSGEEVMEKISELLKQWSEEAGEEREEYSVHDMENFPKQMYSEGMGESSFQKVIDYWEAINGTDYPMEVVEEFASLTGEDVTDAVSKMKDAYYGKFDSVDDFAREYVDSVGGIGGVSNPEQYIEVSETDKRLVASEQADADVENMSDDDVLERADLKETYDNFIERADELGEDEELDDDDRVRTLESEFGYDDSDAIIEEAKEKVREEISSEWEKGLRNPYNFLVEEQGLYDSSSIMKANFIRFDYKKFGKDLEYDYYTIEHDGDVYVFSQNYKKGGSLSSSRSLGVSIEKIEIDIPEFRPEKLKEQTKTNKKPKTMAKKSAGSNKNKERMTMIQSVAKKIWAEGKLKKYSEAVSLAAKQLKKEKKL